MTTSADGTWSFVTVPSGEDGYLRRTQHRPRDKARWFRLRIPAAVVLAGMAYGQSAPSHAERSDIQGLTAEVELLRHEIGRSLAMMTQAQILSLRAASQQGRLDRMLSEEAEVKRRIAGLLADKAKAERTIRAFQSQIAQNGEAYRQVAESGPLIVAQSEEESADTALRQYQGLQEELVAARRVEESKLEDLIKRLAAIEGALESAFPTHAVH